MSLGNAHTRTKGPVKRIPENAGKLVMIDQQIAWYVLRVTYQRELAAKEAMERFGVEAYVPERLVRRRDSHGRFSTFREAAIHNYLFVRTSKLVIDDLKTFRLPMLRYVMHVVDGVRCPMTVPEMQMRHFIAITGNREARILYLSPLEPELMKGDRVRITGGPLEGVEGKFVRIRNTKERCVVVTIEGIAAVATADVSPALVEKIP